MTLNRQTLAKIDKQILSQMDHDEGVQLVKVPVSEAVWSTWRRYCEAVGLRLDMTWKPFQPAVRYSPIVMPPASAT